MQFVSRPLVVLLLSALILVGVNTINETKGKPQRQRGGTGPNRAYKTSDISYLDAFVSVLLVGLLVVREDLAVLVVVQQDILYL